MVHFKGTLLGYTFTVHLYGTLVLYTFRVHFSFERPQLPRYWGLVLWQPTSRTTCWARAEGRGFSSFTDIGSFNVIEVLSTVQFSPSSLPFCNSLLYRSGRSKSQPIVIVFHPLWTLCLVCSYGIFFDQTQSSPESGGKAVSCRCAVRR